MAPSTMESKPSRILTPSAKQKAQLSETTPVEATGLPITNKPRLPADLRRDNASNSNQYLHGNAHGLSDAAQVVHGDSDMINTDGREWRKARWAAAIKKMPANPLVGKSIQNIPARLDKANVKPARPLTLLGLPDAILRKILFHVMMYQDSNEYPTRRSIPFQTMDSFLDM